MRGVSFIEYELGGRFKGVVLENEPMSRHTTYRIGGPARYFIQADTLGSLVGVTELLRCCGIPWIAVGKGSNLLVSDEGFEGAVVVLGSEFNACSYNEQAQTFSVGAGCRLSRVVREAFSRGRAGFEFAVGTPGTVGGALRMNAGTSHEYIGSRVLSITSLRPGQGLKRYNASDVAWGYRETSFPYDEIVLECELSTNEGDKEAIRVKMETALSRRRKTQPLSMPSCGSVFSQSRTGIGGTTDRERRAEGRDVRRCADFRAAREFHRQQGRSACCRGACPHSCRSGRGGTALWHRTSSGGAFSWLRVTIVLHLAFPQDKEGRRSIFRVGPVRSTRSYGRPTQRFGSQGGYGSAQPRVSTVKVGSLAQGMRDERVHKAYRAHMAKAIVLLCLIAVLAATCLGVYWSSLFPSNSLRCRGSNISRRKR